MNIELLAANENETTLFVPIKFLINVIRVQTIK